EAARSRRRAPAGEPLRGLHLTTEPRRGAGGRRVPLRCGGARVARAALRCSLRGAPATTRARVRALRHVAVVAEYRSNPAALRCSAPQRRSTRRPPAPLREPPAQLATARRVALHVDSLGGAGKAVGGRAAKRLCGAEERRGT